MAFVKLDCGILDSTIWEDRDAREVFLTALLMAVPDELLTPQPQLDVRSLKQTGWTVPAGWYGFVAAAGTGIIKRAGLGHKNGFAALERLCEPEAGSRSPEYDGRRMARVSGGYVILNYIRYRERDYTAAERSRRYRERKQLLASRVESDASRVASRNVTQAEADGEAEAENYKIGAPRRAGTA